MPEDVPLGPRAAALREHLARTADPGQSVLVDEAARITDRLDRLNDVIAGKGVLALMHFRHMDDTGQVVEMKVDGVLAEARQQAVALRQILVSLGVGKVDTDAKPRGSTIDALAAKRAARRATGS